MFCCDMMARNVFCADAKEKKSVFYSKRFDEYMIPAPDGSDSGILLSFCPWCGKKLPEISILCGLFFPAAESVSQRPEFQLVENFTQSCCVEFPAFTVINIDRQRYIPPDGGKLVGKSGIICVGLYLFAPFTLDFSGAGEQFLHTAELLDEFLRGLGAHARYPGDVV